MHHPHIIHLPYPLHSLLLFTWNQFTPETSSHLEPVDVSGGLRCGEHLDESLAPKSDSRPHVVGTAQVAVERGGVELGQDVDLADPAVDAVALWETHLAQCQ